MPPLKVNAFGAAVVLLALAAARVGSESHASRARPKRGELDPQTCVENFDIQRDKIIRTEESREMGAKYLNELDVGSREECLRLCCETDTCDVFVFEEKSPGSCYLFNCGPPEDFKCKFTRHTNFSSGVLALSRRLAELQDQVRLNKHEHDLASLRKQAASTARPTTPSPPPTAAAPRPPSPVPTQRRCSPYQFECHGSGECIAIYNACDGVPQCTDGSDEAPELGCPSSAASAPAPPRASPPRAPPPPPRELPPVDQLAAQKMTGADAMVPFLRPAQEFAPRWPHRLMQAQPPALKPYDNSPSSHIFSHKGGLLQEGESQSQQQYVPFESVQDTQWVRRPWQQSMAMEQMPMSDRQLMYHYGPEQAVWKGPAPMQAAEVQGQQLQPLSMQSRDKAEAASAGIPDRDKMWAVPQAPLVKPEPPVYMPAKTMPEAPIMYSNQQETLRDSPKKGFDLGPKKMHSPKQEPAYTQSVEKETRADEESTEEANEHTTKKDISESNETKKKHLDAPPAVKQIQAAADGGKATNEKTKHDIKHDHYKMVEDEHDGLSEKPPGAILLLILGVLMTSVMAVMLGCRLRAARRRMRRAGKSPFAHDADYLVNGMYL